jgi:hypothetical protein
MAALYAKTSKLRKEIALNSLILTILHRAADAQGRWASDQALERVSTAHRSNQKNCGSADLFGRPRQRQALLHWP